MRLQCHCARGHRARAGPEPFRAWRHRRDHRARHQDRRRDHRAPHRGRRRDHRDHRRGADQRPGPASRRSRRRAGRHRSRVKRGRQPAGAACCWGSDAGRRDADHPAWVPHRRNRAGQPDEGRLGLAGPPGVAVPGPAWPPACGARGVAPIPVAVELNGLLPGRGPGRGACRCPGDGGADGRGPAAAGRGAAGLGASPPADGAGGSVLAVTAGPGWAGGTCGRRPGLWGTARSRLDPAAPRPGAQAQRPPG